VRLLVDSVVDYAIFLLTPQGRVASWNRGAERLKGYRPEEIVGQSFDRFYTDADRDAGLPERALARALADGHYEAEGWRVRKDGTRFWANAVLTALHDDEGRHRGFAKVTRDLTARKEAEDAMRDALARERAAGDQLRELDRMKSELVAVVAHDIRGPIALLEGLSDVLRRDWETLDDADRLDMVGRIANRSSALAAFVTNVLDVARIEAGELRLDCGALDLAAVVERAVDDLRTASPDREVAVTIDPAVDLVWGDEQRTWQILTNVLANAAKFSPAGTSVDVAVEADVGAVAAVVSVTDHGPGIPEADRDLLFQRFSRLPHTRGTPGTGMGLYIARSLAEAQGGRIWVDDNAGGGATFRFTIPLHAPAP
jgi:PAS domain S-box-containing protein